MKEPEYEKTSATKNLCGVPKGVSTKEKLAKVLLNKVPKRQLLGKSQNSKDKALIKAYKELIRTCRYCKKDFLASRTNQLDCSTQCRNRGYWERHPERKGGKLKSGEV
jgi:hypothetical protein